MNLSTKELNLIMSWFDIAESGLGDKDLALYDKVKEYLEEKSDDLEDGLGFSPGEEEGDTCFDSYEDE